MRLSLCETAVSSIVGGKGKMGVLFRYCDDPLGGRGGHEAGRIGTASMRLVVVVESVGDG